MAAFERIKSKFPNGTVRWHHTKKQGHDKNYTGRWNLITNIDIFFSLTQLFCSVLNTKIGLHIRGDLPTSNRVYDWVWAEALVVVVADGFHSAAAPGRNIPWREFTFQVISMGTLT